jgi:Bacteriocin-protection, YdeI or OmpD-Associated/Domain of unknown function (DUF1905)
MARRARTGGAQLGEHPAERIVQVLGDLVSQPDPQRRLGVEALSRHEVATGGALADLPQRERRDDRRDDSQLHLGEGERRPRVRERDVAARDEADPAAERVSVDDCHDRGAATVDRLEHPPERVGVGDVRLDVEVGRGSHPLDVGAGAEARPVAAQHDGAGAADVDERLRELGDQRGVERVAALGARERDAEHVSVPIDAERAHPEDPMVSRVAAKRFTVQLERAQKTATMFRVPFDLQEAFGRARPPVKVTIRGHTWRTTPGVYDRVGYVVVNRNVKKETGVDAPDRVRVTMELDTEPRTVRVPDDLRAALRADERAAKSFAAMSFTHRREYVDWVQEAKRPETRARRVAATVERVRERRPHR